MLLRQAGELCRRALGAGLTQVCVQAPYLARMAALHGAPGVGFLLSRSHHPSHSAPDEYRLQQVVKGSLASDVSLGMRCIR